MNDNNRFRIKVQLIILAVVLSLFAIVGCIYAVTLRHYLQHSDPPGKENAVKTEEIKMTETKPEKTESEKEPTSADSVPENNVVQEPSFREFNETAYADEISDAYKVFLSETVYIAVLKETLHGDPYCIAHVIIKSPEQMQTVITAEQRHADSICNENPECIFAINASAMAGYTDFIDGLHISEGKAVNSQDIASGTELAYDNEGKLFMLEKSISLSGTGTSGILWTVLSESPLLIENGETVALDEEIPTDITCKSIIGMVSPCEYYFIAASDGDYLSGISYEDIQNILIGKSCTFAKTLSTGINTVMSMQDEIINQPAEGKGRPQLEYIIIKE